MRSILYKIVGLLAGKSNLPQRTRSLFCSIVVCFFLLIACDVFLYGFLHLKSSAPMWIVFCKMFGAQLVASFFAAQLAPAQPVRHAIAAGVGVYLGSVFGIAIYWADTSPFYYINQAFASLLGAMLAGLLYYGLSILFKKRRTA